jgi:hypothetical protein
MGNKEGFIGQNIRGKETEAIVRYTKAIEARG